MKNERYALNKKTPREMQCVIGSCPEIYELTPTTSKCGFGACPAVYGSKQGSYLIIGKKVGKREVQELGLAKKVGEGEVLIEVPKKLIDRMKHGQSKR